MRRHRRGRRPGGPPEDMPWVWITREMLESPAWSAMSLGARRVLDRILLENMAHAGTHNGKLIVTYDDFVEYGLSSRRATAEAIRVLIALGFVEQTVAGKRCYGGARVASQYAISWLPRCDGVAISSKWSDLTEDTAPGVAATARAAKRAANQPRIRSVRRVA